MINYRWIRTTLYLLLFYIVVHFNSCNKEELELHVKRFGFQDAFVGDTIRMDYLIEGSDFDSVGLLFNDSPRIINSPSESSFIIIVLNPGRFEVKLNVYRNSKIIETRFLGTLSVYQAHAPVKITYTRYDGGSIYFVGDILRIGLSPEWPSTHLTDFREATVYINDVSLGTKTTLPFYFITDTITSDTNRLKVVMVDKDNHVHTTETLLIVPVNTSPYLEYDILFGSYLLPAGHFLSTDRFYITTRGWDNMQVNYVNYFLDNRLIMSDSVKSPQYHRDFLIDTLSPGKHTTYCISYDDRGDSTISEIYDITIYKAIDIGERTKDFVNTGDDILVYALSGSSLYSIDPVGEEIINKAELPYNNATCMDYDKEENKLYIGFADGNLVCYNEIQENFVTLHTFVDGISDIGLDPSLGIGIIVSGTKISLLDFTNNRLVTSGLNLYEGSELIMINSEQKVIAGGRPDLSAGYMYKFSYDQDTLIMEMKNGMGGFINDLHFKPDNSQFVFLSTHNTSGLPVYSVNNLELIIKVGEIYARTCAYDASGNSFYIGYGEGKLQKFDADTYDKQFDYKIYFSTYIQYDKMISNASDTRMVFSTRNMIDDNQGQLVFFRTTE